jgi:hypothetical protein
MKRKLLAGLCAASAAINAHAGLFGADNWDECILDRMPGVQNNIAAYAVERSCNDEFGPPSVRPQPGIFARYKSADQCVVDKSRGTASFSAAERITVACRRLYDRTPPTPLK